MFLRLIFSTIQKFFVEKILKIFSQNLIYNNCSFQKHTKLLKNQPKNNLLYP